MKRLSFNSYDVLKSRLGVNEAANKGKKSSLEIAGGQFVAASAAGTITTLITNPLSVVRSRMILAGNSNRGRYSSVSGSVLRIAKSEGLAGFYKVGKLSHVCLFYCETCRKTLRRNCVPKFRVK